MPISLQIPEDHYTLWKRVIHLSSDEYRDLITAITTTPVVGSFDVFAESVASKVDPADSELIEDFVGLLAVFYGHAREADVSIFTYAAALVEALKETGQQELDPAGGTWSSVQERLTELLSIDSLQLEVKALDLWVENGRTYHDVSIITDIRPIFRDNPDEPPGGALILNTLVLKFHHLGEVESVRVLLDSGGINDLRQALNRAESKTRNLQRLLASANIPVIREESL